MYDKKVLFNILIFILTIHQNITAQTFDPFLQDFYPHPRHIIKTVYRTPYKNITPEIPVNACWEFDGPEGGRVNCICTDPANRFIFVSILGGGVYTSENQALTWTKQLLNPDKDTCLSITDLDYNGNRLLAAGMGGLYKSLDNGQTWELLSYIQGYTILSMPTQPDTIIVGVYAQSSMNLGGFVRSNDGGVSWQQYNDGLASTRITNLVLSPHFSGRIYACTTDGVYMSQNGGMDGWTDIGGNLPPGLVFALCCDRFVENTLYAGLPDGLYKSLNGGGDWANITPDIFPDKDIRVIFQESESLLYVGTSNGLFITKDSGKTWRNINHGLRNTAVKAINADNQNNIMVGTEDGFYIKSKNDTTWQRMVAGMHAFDTRCFLFNRTDSSSVFYAGTGGAGIYYKNPDTGWQDAGVDSGFCYVMDLQKAYDLHAIYVGTIEGYSRKYQDTISKIFCLPDGDKVRRQFLFPLNLFKEIFSIFVYSKDILFFGGNNGIYRSLNGGGSWEQLPYSVKINPVCSIICPENSSGIFAGTQIDPDDYHGIYKSTDMGDTWTNTCRGLYNEFIDIQKICYNPLNPKTMYAANITGLLKSMDGGETWTIIDENLIYTDDAVNTVTVHPVDTNRVYIAGRNVYFSENAGSNWRPFYSRVPVGSGIINDIAVDPLEPDKIYIATSGNGLLSYKGIETSVEKENPIAPQQFVLYNNYPNPFNPETIIKYDLPEADHVTLQIYDIRGREAATLVNSQQKAGKHEVKWTGRDKYGSRVASGVYFYRIRYRDFTVTRKMVLAR